GGQRFDAVVDVATMSLRWVRDALAQLRATAGHWCFVSSVNVYADTRTRGQSPGAPLLEPAAEDPPAGAEAMPSAEVYGAVKVASENAVREAVGDRALIVRPGLICGPGDVWDRFGYWVMRFTRGGRVLVPDSPEQPIQYIDVRDLADWLVLAAEQRVTGTYDAVGPVTELRELLRGISAITSPPGTELAAMPPEELLAAGVTPWSGPKSLPLWAPESHWGLPSHDPGPAAQQVCGSARWRTRFERCGEPSSSWVSTGPGTPGSPQRRRPVCWNPCRGGCGDSTPAGRSGILHRSGLHRREEQVRADNPLRTLVRAGRDRDRAIAVRPGEFLVRVRAAPRPDRGAADPPAPGPRGHRSPARAAGGQPRGPADRRCRHGRHAGGQGAAGPDRARR